MTAPSPDHPASPSSLLSILKEWIPRLHPPVFAFESAMRTPFQIVISVLLSSRTKDETTAKAAQRLFSRAKTPERIAALGEETIARLIYPVGFYRQKARYILEICRRLGKNHPLPRSLDELMSLPGVGRKTANLVLSLAWREPSIAVDTHVFRISRRLGWAKGTKPEEVEKELKTIFPRRQWSRLNQILVGFGQTICRPRRPFCYECRINSSCPAFLSMKEFSGEENSLQPARRKSSPSRPAS